MKKTILVALIALCALWQPADAAKKKAKHLVFIGIDGWASWCVEQADNIPNFRALMEGGAWTLHKRSVMPSASAINWATIFNGLPTEQHGYYRWNSKSPDIPAAVDKDRPMPKTIYTILKEQRPGAVNGCVFNWSGIGYVVDSTAVVRFNSCNVKQYASVLDYTLREAVPYILEQKPEFFTFYIDNQDGAGHSKGWGSPEYYDMMSQIDVCVGHIIQALKDAGIYDDTIIIVTSDHGGKNKGHGGFTIEELESPFIAFGKGIKKGYEIPDPMMQYDVPATFAHILGLKIPAAWRGRPMTQIYK